jgi:hypothetical protein
MLQQNRNLLCCLVLLCSATSSYAAEPQRWCFGVGGPSDQRAELVFLDDGVIQMNGKVLEIRERERVMIGTMDVESTGASYKDQKVVIYQDRVFWPCS